MGLGRHSFGIFAIYTAEFIYAKRHPHIVQFREAAKWVVVYIAAAILFGIGIWTIKGQDAGIEFLQDGLLNTV